MCVYMCVYTMGMKYVECVWSMCMCVCVCVCIRCVQYVCSVYDVSVWSVYLCIMCVECVSVEFIWSVYV